MKSWWQQRTLRFRLALWYSLGGALLFAGFSAVLYFYVDDRMARPLSQPLRRDLGVIRQHLHVGSDRQVYWDNLLLAADAPWPADLPWFELWDEDRQLVRRFWPFQEADLSRVPQAPTPRAETLSVFQITRDTTLRTFATSAGAGLPADWMIRVIKIHQPAAAALEALLLIILIALPLVVALLVAGGYFITRRWLKPLELMVTRAEGITADNLSLRLPADEADDELGRLAAAFNRTLGRLEDSFRTLDRFVADASHELRTPLTTLRSVGEVGLRRSRTVEEYREIIGSMLEEAQRLHQLVERLLELASAEGGGKSVHRERLRLDQFVTACVGEIGILAEYKNQQIAITAVECLVDADPVLLRQAFQNLMDNAMKYSPVGATVRVEVTREGGECRIAVTDEGPGVPPGHAARIADRFYRVEDSRVRGRGGFGLGLAITQAYLRIMGGRLEYAPGRPKGGCFSLVLPAAPAGRDEKNKPGP